MSSIDIEVRTKPRFDYAHRLLVASAITGISALLIFALVGHTGLLAAGLAVMLRLLLSPALICTFHPRFRRARALSPALAPEAFTVVDQLAQRVDLAHAPVLLVGAKRGLAVQMIATPFGAAIVLTQDMLQALDRRELAGVLAHEIGHIKNHDGYLAWGLNAAAMIALIFAVTSAVLGWSRLEGLNVLALPDDNLVGGAMLVLSILVMLLNVAVLQALEGDADLAAVELTGDPGGLASALIEQERMGLTGAAPALSSHPPIKRRVSQLNAIASAIADRGDHLPPK